MEKNFRKGIDYEEKVQHQLQGKYENYTPGPWIEYKSGKFIGVCQPDGLLFDFHQGVITVAEIKLSHVARAYFQLTELYVPVVKLLFPEDLWTVRPLEIARNVDMDREFPVKAQFLDWPHKPAENFPIVKWNPDTRVHRVG